VIRCSPELWDSSSDSHLREDLAELRGEVRRLRDSRQTAVAEMTSMINHEVRTPLNGIMGMTSLLRTTRLDPEQVGYVEIIERSSDNLLTLVNDALDFRRADLGELDLDRVAFDPRECVERAYELVAQSRDHSEQVALNLHIDKDAPDLLQGDPVRLQQVVHELLRNAVKFTREGRIDLFASRRVGEEGDPELCIEVADTGFGISPDRLSQIFEPFQQADSGKTRRFGGLGLGLALTRHIAELLGGRLHVESILNRGSTFRLTLPLDSASATAKAAPGVTVAAIDPDRVENLQRANPAVLIVDDNQVNQRVVGMMLQRLGLEPQCVSDGVEAVEICRQRAFDIVLMDLHMPQLDGALASEMILQEGGSKAPWIIALSADHGGEAIRRFVEVGVTEYLVKPVMANELTRTLCEWCESRPEETTASARRPADCP
jgi:CheY-like chemotaxis protein